MTDTLPPDTSETSDGNVVELRPHQGFSDAVRQRSAAAGDHVDVDQLEVDVQAILLVSASPVTAAELAAACEVDESVVEDLLAEMLGRYVDETSGIVLERVSGGWAFRASERAHPALARLAEPSADTRLTPAALETLAIIAYAQPISRPDIARVRGVSADAAVSNLLDRGLIADAGRSDTGAMRFRTTATFERAFGLASLAALPPLEGFAPGQDDVDELRRRLEKVAAARVD